MEGGPPRFRPRFTAVVLLRCSISSLARFRLRDGCPLWCAVPRASTNDQIGNCCRIGHDPDTSPTTPNWQRRQPLPPARFRLVPFRSPLLRESRLFSFPTGYLDVSVHLVPSTHPMCSGGSTTPLRVVGFPIRISAGQSLIGSSPQHFAAFHVLHRQ